MRISNQAIQTRIINTIQGSLADIGRLERQITTGQRYINTVGNIEQANGKITELVSEHINVE